MTFSIQDRFQARFLGTPTIQLLLLGAALGGTACSSGGGGGGGITPVGSFYACNAAVVVDSHKYTLPNDCFGVDSPDATEPVTPSDGPTLKLRGVCVCADSDSVAKNACNDGTTCDSVLSSIFKEKAVASQAGLVVPAAADIHCVAAGSTQAGAPISVTQTAKTCNLDSTTDHIGIVTSGLTAANGDYEAPVTNLALTIAVKKQIVGQICVPLLGCTPEVDYDDSAGFTAQGQIRYSYDGDGRGGCSAGGCSFRVDSLVLNALGQSRTFSPPVGDNVTISNLDLRAMGTIAGAVQSNGTLAASGLAVVRFDVNGASHSLNSNLNLTGHFDAVTGELVLDSLTLVDGDKGDDTGRKTVTIASIDGVPAQHPPHAQITAPPAVECQSATGTKVLLSSASSTDLENDIARQQWLLPDHSAPLGVTTNANLGYGPSVVGVLVSDARLGTTLATQTVTVVDTTPPVLKLASRTNYSLCDAGNEPVILDPPTATDSCTGVSRIYGQATGPNGVPTTFPAGSSVKLGLGNQLVRWFAQDAAGNVSELDQTMTIAPAFTAFDTFEVRDQARVSILGSSGARPGIVGNAGTSITEIGALASVGSVLSKANVFLRSNSTASGDVISLGSITLQAGAKVTGAQRAHTDPALPSSMLLWASQPATHGGNSTVNSGVSTTLVPGAYGGLILNSNARVTLQTGRYTFDSLLVDSAAVFQIAAGAKVELVIRGDFTYRGNFVVTGSGSTSVDVLTFGTTVFLGPSQRSDAWYGYTLLAPNAYVTIGNDLNLAQLAARSIDLAAPHTLACVRRN